MVQEKRECFALNWNIVTKKIQIRRSNRNNTNWFKLLDPYQLLVVLQTFPIYQALVYGRLYEHAKYDGASIQTEAQDVFQETLSCIQVLSQQATNASLSMMGRGEHCDIMCVEKFPNLNLQKM